MAGDYARALEYQDKLMPLHVAIFLEPGVAGAKYAMSRLGLCSDRVRLPLVGLTDATSDLVGNRHTFGADTRVRHLVGLDPQRQGVAVSELVEVGMQLAFCQRNVAAARQDLVRICAEIREEFDPPEGPSRIPAGALYISCAGRGGPHFGGPDAELQIIAHALGEIPLVGMFAGGEIARHHLYGYTGVLTVWA